MGEELKQLSLLNLRDLAKAKSIKNISKMNKEELIEAILNVQENEVVNEENENEVKFDIDTKSLELEGAKLNSKDDFVVEGVLEVLPDGFGFLRGENYLSTPKDVYVSPVQILSYLHGK